MGSETGPSTQSAEDSGLEPVVLLHGLSGCTAQWRPIVPLLRPHHRTLALALAGHTGGARLPTLRGGGALQAVAALADDLETQMDVAGVTCAHIVGNSLGGWLGLELARRGRARSVVAIAPAGGWKEPSAEQRRIRRRLRRNYYGLKLIGPVAALATRSATARRALLQDAGVGRSRPAPTGFELRGPVPRGASRG